MERRWFGSLLLLGLVVVLALWPPRPLHDPGTMLSTMDVSVPETATPGSVPPAPPQAVTPNQEPVQASWSLLLRLAAQHAFARAVVDVDTGTVIATFTPQWLASPGEQLRGQAWPPVLAVNIPPNDTSTLSALRTAGVDVEVIYAAPDRTWWQGLALPIFLLFLVVVVPLLWVAVRRHVPRLPGMSPFADPARSRISTVEPGSNATRLRDVAGCDEAKREVAEIIEFLRTPERFARVGAKAPRGVLLVGPPGTGKTLLAKAVAGEAGVPFFVTSGSDFVEVFVGVGAARMRDTFRQAKASAPAIVFIDEIDSIGRRRSASTQAGGHEERENALNALLVEMDGFKDNVGVIVMAATNRQDILDPALLRPGRFDRTVALDLPDRAGRLDILRTHARTIVSDPGIDWAAQASATVGFSGADLANLVNEAAIMAARRASLRVENVDLEHARDRVLMGLARAGITDPATRRTVAYHEAGHAVAAHFSPLAEPVHKITILPRGSALGMTMQSTSDEALNRGRSALLTDIRVLLGGRAAEDLALGEVTVGAASDFQRATNLARRMISQWGMGDLGVMSMEPQPAYETAWSESWRAKVDDAVHGLIQSQYKVTRSLLEMHRQALDALANALVAEETIHGHRLEEMLGPRQPAGD